jgi:hypothetical protein
MGKTNKKAKKEELTILVQTEYRRDKIKEYEKIVGEIKEKYPNIKTLFNIDETISDCQIDEKYVKGYLGSVKRSEEFKGLTSKQIERVVKFINDADFQKQISLGKSTKNLKLALDKGELALVNALEAVIISQGKQKELVVKKSLELQAEEREEFQLKEAKYLLEIEVLREKNAKLKQETNRLKKGVGTIGTKENISAKEEFAKKMVKYTLDAFAKLPPSNKNENRPSTYKIARFFNDKGLKTRTGKRFEGAHVFNLLKTQEKLGYLNAKDFENTPSNE